MQIHERYFKVKEAKGEIEKSFLYIAEKFQLTPVEELQILNEIMNTSLKWCLRQERHPNNPNLKADEVDESKEKLKGE